MFYDSVKHSLASAINNKNAPNLDFLCGWCDNVGCLQGALSLSQKSKSKQFYSKLKTLCSQSSLFQERLLPILKDQFDKNKENTCHIYQRINIPLNLEQVKAMLSSPDLLVELFAESDWLKKMIPSLAQEFSENDNSQATIFLQKYFEHQTKKLSPVENPSHISLPINGTTLATSNNSSQPVNTSLQQISASTSQLINLDSNMPNQITGTSAMSTPKTSTNPSSQTARASTLSAQSSSTIPLTKPLQPKQTATQNSSTNKTTSSTSMPATPNHNTQLNTSQNQSPPQERNQPPNSQSTLKRFLNNGVTKKP